jgi:membrane associated rhomboid family serine protease
LGSAGSQRPIFEPQAAYEPPGVYGNVVCAKFGNLKHLPLYVLLGVSAGAAHLLFDGEESLGASGAINGIIGAYTVLFYPNQNPSP